MIRQSTKPSISIIIPAFNEAEFIAKTLKAIFTVAKSYAGHVEILVVDNNSTDNTAEIASSMGAIVVFEAKNQIARARNSGAKKATGDYLVFVDADTILEGDILDKVSANLSCGKVIGGGAWTEPDLEGPGYFIFKYVINYLLALKNITLGPFLYCDYQAFLRVDGFDESYYAGEEFSLARRLKKEGKNLNKSWKIIKFSPTHRIITSSRRFGHLCCNLDMVLKNFHLLWNMDHKLKKKSECSFWYKDR